MSEEERSYQWARWLRNKECLAWRMELWVEEDEEGEVERNPLTCRTSQLVARMKEGDEGMKMKKLLLEWRRRNRLWLSVLFESFPYSCMQVHKMDWNFKKGPGVYEWAGNGPIWVEIGWAKTWKSWPIKCFMQCNKNPKFLSTPTKPKTLQKS